MVNEVSDCIRQVGSFGAAGCVSLATDLLAIGVSGFMCEPLTGRLMGWQAAAQLPSNMQGDLPYHNHCRQT